MTFQDCFSTVAKERAGEASPLKRAALEAAMNAKPGEHPVMWRVMERRAARQYERQTGKKPPQDWAAVVDWLRANWQQILSALVAIIIMFL